MWFYYICNKFGGGEDNLKLVGKQHILPLEIYFLWNLKLQCITVWLQLFLILLALTTLLTSIMLSLQHCWSLHFFDLFLLAHSVILFLSPFPSTSHLDSIHYLLMFLPINLFLCFLSMNHTHPEKQFWINRTNCSPYFCLMAFENY